MELIEIEKLFTQKSFQKRIDFINDSNISNIKEKDFLAKIIINTKESSNDWYLIALIGLAVKLQIKDKGLVERYLKYLIEPNSYYLKLSVLDYITDTKEIFKDYNIDYRAVRQIINNKHDRLIVRNQALLNLIQLYPLEKDDFMRILKKNLSKTTDYRSHIRIFNNIMETSVRNYLPVAYIKDLMRISESMNLGRGTIDAINRLGNILD
ncbi:MAG: hypothetical protein LBV43_07970 [Prevotella sp.]|jgi:hypothetical protein|nr:hypothetical protein [Prevotella sp.]